MKWSKAILRQYTATFSCLICSTMSAITFIWFTPLMVWLLDPSNGEIVGLDNDEMSWLIAIIEVGELIGPLPGGYIADKWGRKPCLLLTFPLVISSWLIIWFTRSVTWLYVARLVQGTSIGILLTIGPIYTAEIAQPEIRGALAGQLQTMWFAGLVYAYCSGPFLSYQSYIVVSAVPAFLFAICFYFMPETPYFLVMSERRKDAEESLSWLRGDVDVQSELKSIEEAIGTSAKEKKRGGWRDLFFSQECRKSLTVLTIITAVKYLTGTTTITSFATQTFSKSLDDPGYADVITIMMGLVLMITSIFASLVCDSFGRKPLVIFSTAGLFVTSSAVAAYYYLERQTLVDVSGYSWCVYAGTAIYCITFNLGLGPVQMTVQAEYFPSHVRAAAGGYATIISDFICFISIKQYQLFDDYIGVYANFLLFAVVSFVGLILLTAFMEETAKKPLK